MSETVKLTTIKKNPDNPRILRDDKFQKLKASIRDFPQMMALRPIVIDDSGMILGGNMRFEAIKSLGMKEIPGEWVKRADDLTENEKREFIIKDNVGFGEWDWDVIANEWSALPLVDGGLDVPDGSMEVDAIEVVELRPYAMIHVLISCQPDIFSTLLPLLDKIRAIDGVEYEQSANG